MMNAVIQISELMSRDLITVSPDDTMQRVNEIFKSHEIHHIPVINKQNNLVGIISKTDFHTIMDSLTLFKPEKSDEINAHFFKTILVEEVMSKQLAKLHPDDSVLVAAGIFKENLFHALPIVDDNDQLVGIITTYDLLRHCYNQLSLLE